MNIGIVGYGNLGKAVEKTLIAQKQHNLVAIFSRRSVVSDFGTKVEKYENFKNYEGKIDLMLLCGGSKSDLLQQTPEVVQHFDVINTFDTHKKIPDEFAKIDRLAKDTNHRAILCCGWDPGLFSIMRALFFAITQKEPNTFWGKGVSMGHSDALRRVKDVEDAVQFTIPNKMAREKVKKGQSVDGQPLHFRECFVATNSNNTEEIERQIKNIPNYFLGQPTNVHFVDKKEVQRLKLSMYHSGEVISAFELDKNKSSMTFAAQMDSNPMFTASIVCAYVMAVSNLKNLGLRGAFTPLDIAPSLLFEDRIHLLSTFC